MNNKFKCLPYLKPDDDNPGDGDAPETSVTQKEPEGKSAEQWMASYKGLQRKYDLLKAKYDKVVEENETLSTKIADLELGNDEMKKKVETAESATTSLTDKVKELEKMKEEKEKDISRMKVVMNDFPELADLIDTDIIPKNLDGDELTNQLKILQGKLDSMAKKRNSSDYSGIDSTSTSSMSNSSEKTDTKLDEDTIYEQMARLAGSRAREDIEKYEKLQRQLIELQTK